jgi:omega-hydroxy-beta-dihydromenaquinone-9 sulfotransferase
MGPEEPTRQPSSSSGVASSFWPIACPYVHFMAFAPLDVWFRLLFRPRVHIPPRFWLRLAFALVLSTIITVLTLPERLLAALYLRLSRCGKPLPGPVIVLGYYRSGTTLLQYLLSCDRNLYAPHWGQAFAPQGWCLTWWLLRWFILPFFPRNRPQDNVAFGPLVPAEDDFALNNWGPASPLAGRLVVPQQHRFYDRFHDLKSLTLPERRRWGGRQLDFLRKLAVLAAGRRVLLKTPAHTARIPALLDLFQHTTGAKFIYISRHPHKVFPSNLAMLRQLMDLCALQLPLNEEELEQYVLDEYLSTEEAYNRTRSLVPAGDLAEVRLQNLQADPLGTLRRLYEQLGLPFTPEFEQRVLVYLHANRNYQPNVHTPPTERQKERMGEVLRPLVERGGHDDPIPASVPLPDLPRSIRRRRWLGGLTLGMAASVHAFVLLWLLASWLGIHSLGFAWPAAVVIGVASLHGSSRQGSGALGAYALLLTAATVVAALLLAPRFWLAFQEQLLIALPLGVFWWCLSLASAYRIGSQCC